MIASVTNTMKTHKYTSGGATEQKDYNDNPRIIKDSSMSSFESKVRFFSACRKEGIRSTSAPSIFNERWIDCLAKNKNNSRYYLKGENVDCKKTTLKNTAKNFKRERNPRAGNFRASRQSSMCGDKSQPFGVFSSFRISGKHEIPLRSQGPKPYAKVIESRSQYQLQKDVSLRQLRRTKKAVFPSESADASTAKSNTNNESATLHRLRSIKESINSSENVDVFIGKSDTNNEIHMKDIFIGTGRYPYRLHREGEMQIGNNMLSRPFEFQGAMVTKVKPFLQSGRQFPGQAHFVRRMREIQALDQADAALSTFHSG